MSWSIWKFKLSPGEHRVVPMPDGARVVHVAEQSGAVTLWAEVDESKESVNRHFFVVGTGWVNEGCPGKYIGTVFVGPFVWHVYELD